MKKMNLLLIVVLMVANGLSAMSLFQSQPQTTAGQMAYALKGYRKDAKKQFNNVKNQAANANPLSEVAALRNEINGTITDLTGMGTEVNGMVEDLSTTADVGLEFVEDAVNKNAALKKNPKLKKRVLNALSGTREVLPTLLAIGIVTFLGYTYVNMSATPQAKPWWRQKFDSIAGNIAMSKIKGVLPAWMVTPEPAEPQHQHQLLLHQNIKRKMGY